MRLRDNGKFAVLLQYNTMAPVKLYEGKNMGELFPLVGRNLNPEDTRNSVTPVYHIQERQKEEEGIEGKEKKTAVSKNLDATQQEFFKKFDFQDTALTEKQLKELKEMLWKN